MNEAVSTTTFSRTCPWGCTIQVVEGVEQTHLCRGTSLILDAMRTAQPSGPISGTGMSNVEYAQHIARALDPDLRVLKNDSWETGVKDGRSGELFYGIDQINLASP